MGKEKVTLTKTFETLADVTTVHGLRYAIRSNTSHGYDRILWIVIVISATIAVLASSFKLYLDWQNSPVVTTIGNASLPINVLDFPSVTVCNPGNDVKSLYKVYQVLKDDWGPFWKSLGRSDSFKDLSIDEKNTIAAQFVISLLPGWPSGMGIETFVLHMTSYYPVLIKFLLVWEKETPETPGFDLYLNPDRYDEMNDEITEKDKKIQEQFKDLDFSSYKTHKVLLAILWCTNRLCKDLFVSCIWKGQAKNCYDMFKLIPTDIGFCCSFNHDPVKDMLKNSQFANILDEIELSYTAYERSLGWTNPKWSLNQSEIKPQSGKQNGLSFVIDLHSDQYSTASVANNFHGVHIAVTPPNEFPLIKTSSFILSSGRETHVEISAEQTATTNDLKKVLKPSERKCYYKDERALEHFANYTLNSCWMEYLINASRLENENRCHPWNFPSVDSAPCKPHEQDKFLTKFRSDTNDKVFGTDECLPDCEKTVYLTSISSGPFRDCDLSTLGMTFDCEMNLASRAPHKWGAWVKKSYEVKSINGTLPDYVNQIRPTKRKLSPFHKTVYGSDEYEAYENDIISATFYFNRPVALELVTAPRLTFIQFFSNIGGLLGLFIGFSVISGIEIIYWFTIGYLASKFDPKPKERKPRPLTTLSSVTNNELPKQGEDNDV